jgi:hypothetical protein
MTPSTDQTEEVQGPPHHCSKVSQSLPLGIARKHKPAPRGGNPTSLEVRRQLPRAGRFIGGRAAS